VAIYKSNKVGRNSILKIDKRLKTATMLKQNSVSNNARDTSIIWGSTYGV